MSHCQAPTAYRPQIISPHRSHQVGLWVPTWGAWSMGLGASVSERGMEVEGARLLEVVGERWLEFVDERVLAVVGERLLGAKTTKFI